MSPLSECLKLKVGSKKCTDHQVNQLKNLLNIKKGFEETISNINKNNPYISIFYWCCSC